MWLPREKDKPFLGQKLLLETQVGTNSPGLDMPSSQLCSQDEQQRPVYFHFSWHRTPLLQAFQGSPALLLWARPSLPASVNPAHHVSPGNWDTEPPRPYTGLWSATVPMLSVSATTLRTWMFVQRRTSDFQMTFVTTALLPCGDLSGRNQYIMGKNNEWLFYEILNPSRTEQSVESLNRNNKKINSLSVFAQTDAILKHEVQPPTVGRVERAASYTRTCARSDCKLQSDTTTDQETLAWV